MLRTYNGFLRNDQERLYVLELQSLEVQLIDYGLILLYKLVNGLIDMIQMAIFHATKIILEDILRG